MGSGKTLVQKQGTRQEFKFDTPRGRLVVQSKEMDPVWVPPDWHYVEQAKKKGLGIMRARPEEGDSGRRRHADPGRRERRGEAGSRTGSKCRSRRRRGTRSPRAATSSSRHTAPISASTRARLGGHRLNMGDGYALHGTDEPLSIGKAVSHGCVRLRNEDIAYLYSVVPVGTAVFIY